MFTLDTNISFHLVKYQNCSPNIDLVCGRQSAPLPRLSEDAEVEAALQVASLACVYPRAEAGSRVPHQTVVHGPHIAQPVGHRIVLELLLHGLSHLDLSLGILFCQPLQQSQVIGIFFVFEVLLLFNSFCLSTFVFRIPNFLSAFL